MKHHFCPLICEKNLFLTFIDEGGNEKEEKNCWKKAACDLFRHV